MRGCRVDSAASQNGRPADARPKEGRRDALPNRAEPSGVAARRSKTCPFGRPLRPREEDAAKISGRIPEAPKSEHGG